MAWRDWFSRHRQREQEFEEEVQSHLRIAIQERIVDGEDPKAARLAALKEFGNVTLTREASRRVWRGAFVEYLADLWWDISYGARLLRRSPGYAAVVVAVLALGVGANAAVFTIFKAAFLTPLPGVDDATQLAVVVGRGSGGQAVTVSYPDYEHLRGQTTTFSGLVASSAAPFSLGAGNRVERVWGELVSGNYFQVLGISVSLGRALLPSDESAAGRDAVAVISDGLWRRAFGADPAIVGRTILINAQPLTVVGVAEPGFHGSMLSLMLDVFIPLTMQPQVQGPANRLDDEGTRWLILLGRLESGASVAAAAAQMELLSARLATDDPVGGVAMRATAIPLWRSPFGAQTFLIPVVGLLAVTGLFVLAIVSANLANLVFARGLTRRGEIAVRLALGASRGRIVRLLLVEHLVLAIPAAVAGLLLAVYVFSQGGADPSFSAVAPTQFDTPTDGLVIGFAIAVSCATVLLFGFIPALRGSRVPLAAVMKEDGTRTGPARARLRSALVVAQVAASLLLLVTAGLLLRAVEAARTADVGFDANDVVSVRLDLTPSGYDEARGRVFYDELLARLRVAPGVDAASLADFVPLRFAEGASGRVVAEGYEAGANEDMNIARNFVSTEYFRSLRIGLAAGREFSPADRTDAPPVVVVNETIARRFWGSPESALGKRLHVGGDDGEWRTVVGVARDIKYLTLNEPPTPYFYMPTSQMYRSEITVHVRGAAAGADLIEQVRSEMRSIDANVPVLEARTLSEQARTGVVLYETVSNGLIWFGLIALALAAVGIYGLVSYTARQRTHEIGIRMAIGAPRSDVVRRVLQGGLRLGVVGAMVGLAAAFGLTRLLSALLYGTGTVDPLVFGGACVVVLAAVVLASLGPALRASRTDPLVALRHQ